MIRRIEEPRRIKGVAAGERRLHLGARATLAAAIGLAAACNAPTDEIATSMIGGVTTDVSTSVAGDSASTSTEPGSDSGPPPACQAQADCDDGDVCNGAEVCNASHACEAGEPPQEPTECGIGMMCADGECVAAVCGNGELEPGEHCDDMNLDPFDGCDQVCRYEAFFRFYELTLMKSPAATFCERPTSALGDALSSFVLGSQNAQTQADINQGIRNSLFQLVGVDDFSGMSEETIEIRLAGSIPDPARGTWPTDASNPIDWWFLVHGWDVAPDGDLGVRIQDVALEDGLFIGGPGENSPTDQTVYDVAMRARFSDTVDPTVPAGPPDVLADGIKIPQEIIGDGPDDGICSTLTVGYFVDRPVSELFADCLECPGVSHTYTPCADGQVTDACNSLLDSIVGGCVLGLSCDSGITLITPTQPDVDRGGVAVLTNDPAKLNKIPPTQTDGNLNGYSTYSRFRARRAHATGVH